MKKNLYAYRLIALSFLLLASYGCKKTSIHNFNSGENIHLVSLKVASQIAKKFNTSSFVLNKESVSFKNSFATAQRASPDSKNQIKADNKIKNYFIENDSSGIPAFYVFNFEENKGALFVSADFKIEPILAYIQEGEIPENFAVQSATVPFGVYLWVRKTLSAFNMVRNGKYDNTHRAHISWNSYMNNNGIIPPLDFTTGFEEPIDPDPGPGGCVSTNTTILFQAGPLLHVTWGQQCSYNNLCPPNNCSGCSTNTYTGCVATAMAQVVQFWRPVNDHHYNYFSMPTASGDFEVQRLMSDAGLSVNMRYGCGNSVIRTADIPVVTDALINDFGFVSANYVTGLDVDRIRTNIQNGWPVLLGGTDPSNNAGHEWVCDGYQSTMDDCGSTMNTMLHMNWGWHDVGMVDYNGWFGSNYWLVNGTNFSDLQSMISEIHL